MKYLVAIFCLFSLASYSQVNLRVKGSGGIPADSSLLYGNRWLNTFKISDTATKTWDWGDITGKPVFNLQNVLDNGNVAINNGIYFKVSEAQDVLSLYADEGRYGIIEFRDSTISLASLLILGLDSGIIRYRQPMYYLDVKAETLTDARTIRFPDKSGTVLLTTDTIQTYSSSNLVFSSNRTHSLGSYSVSTLGGSGGRRLRHILSDFFQVRIWEDSVNSPEKHNDLAVYDDGIVLSSTGISGNLQSRMDMNPSSIVLRSKTDDNNTILFHQDAGGNALFMGFTTIGGTINGSAFELTPDSSIAHNPIMYKQNYGSLFTPRSLVDRNYVDSALLSAPAAQNLGNSNLVVTSDRTLFMEDKEVRFYKKVGNNILMEEFLNPDNGWRVTNWGDTLNTPNQFYRIQINPGGDGIGLNAVNGTDYSNITVGSLSIGITAKNNGIYVEYDSTIVSKKVVYTGNFGAGFTPRSLVDKNYVDSSIASISSPGIASVISRGTFAQRPVSPDTGAIYWQTDRLSGQWQYSGSEWQFLGVAENYILNNRFFSVPTENIQAAGLGASTFIFDTTKGPGFLRLTTGSTTTGAIATGSTTSSAASSNYYLLIDSVVRYFETRVKLSALSNATDDYDVAIGFNGHQWATLGNLVVFRYNYTVYGGNWDIRSRGPGGTTSKNTGVPVVANTWYKLAFEIDGYGKTIKYYIDDVLVGTMASPDDVPFNATLLTNLQYNFLVLKLAGTTPVTLDAQYIKYYQTKAFSQ